MFLFYWRDTKQLKHILYRLQRLLLRMQINKLVPCYAPFFLLDLDNKTSIIPKSEDDIDANIPIVNKI